jgi:tetratricopeptide (TPR) repeat protein
MNMNSDTTTEYRPHNLSTDPAVDTRFKRAREFHQQGLQALEQGNMELGLTCLEQALHLSPRSAPLHADYAASVALQGQFAKALEHLSQAIQLNPREANYFCQLSQIFITLEQYPDAYTSLEIALSLEPHNSHAFDLLGLAHLSQGLWSLARQAFVQSLQLNPHSAETWNNLGLALKELGEFDAAIEHFKRATQVNPTFSDGFFNLGITYLLLGNEHLGWPLYLAHKRVQGLKGRSRLGSLWDGQAPLQGKTILVYHEQGLGDSIQFCRYLEGLVTNGARVLFASHPKLVELLSTLATPITFVNIDDEQLSADYHCPLLSLPALLPAIHTLTPPYLSADPSRIRHWQNAIGVHGFKVGIHWQGSIGRVDFGRSIPIEYFKPLCNVPGVRLLSLQKGEGLTQLSNQHVAPMIELIREDWDHEGQAFIDTAAIITHLDLVITSDTALAHLAGALGKPVWVVLKFVPDWRWQLNEPKSPWYPKMRLFRQLSEGDWASAFTQVQQALKELINNTV